MKKTLMLISIFALLLVASEPVKLVRLTAINKSGIEIAIQLFTADYENFYYLTIPEGSRGNPTTKTFTIVPAAYRMQVFYIETYDPVYGFSCAPAPATMLIAKRNLKVVFTECGEIPPNRGEPSMMKYWFWFRRVNAGYIY